MSEEQKYDHPYRLIEIGGLTAGVGKTIEEAEEAKKQIKRNAVPSIPMTRPENPEPGDADLAIVGRLEDIFRTCAEIRGIVEGEPEGVYPPKFQDLVLDQLFAILESGDVLWQALAPNPARMTMPGFFAKVVRDGEDPKSIKLVVKKKE